MATASMPRNKTELIALLVWVLAQSFHDIKQVTISGFEPKLVYIVCFSDLDHFIQRIPYFDLKKESLKRKKTENWPHAVCYF